MKKLLIVLGAVVLVLGIVVASTYAYVVATGGERDAQSKVFVDESIPAIFSTWSKAELVSRMSPEIRQKVSDEAIVKLITTLSDGLGKFVSYDGAQGQSSIRLSRHAGGLVASATYLAHVTCEHGKATVSLNLVRENGAWLISDFSVKPEGP